MTLPESFRLPPTSFPLSSGGVVTGKRGPLSGARYGAKGGVPGDPERQKRLGRPSHTAKATAKSPGRALKALPAVKPTIAAHSAPPAHLGVVGAAVWRDLWDSMPILSPRIDAHSVTRYCEASDDAARARAEVEQRGLVIDEVIPDPRGGVVGYKAVINPAEAALRRADKVLTELGDRLGLSPAARARLGLVINQAELAGAEANRILGSMFTRPIIEGEEA